MNSNYYAVAFAIPIKLHPVPYINRNHRQTDRNAKTMSHFSDAISSELLSLTIPCDERYSMRSKTHNLEKGRPSSKCTALMKP